MAQIKKITFIGSKLFGLQTLKKICELSPGLIKNVVSCDDGNDVRSCKSDFIDFAQAKGLRIAFSSNRQMTHNLIKDGKPDLCFVNGWYQLLSSETLSLASHGFVGVHHSLLPKYRGGSPLVWQLINQEKMIGSSLFYLSEGVDSGKLIFQVSMENHLLYIDDARKKLETLFLEKLESIWTRFLAGEVSVVSQVDSSASYCSSIMPEDGRVNWSKSALSVVAKIRAQSLPYPCAYCLYDEKQLKLVKASLFPGYFYGIPGQLVGFDQAEKYPIIACGDGNAVILEQCMFDDGVVVRAQDILKSVKIRLA